MTPNHLTPDEQAMLARCELAKQVPLSGDDPHHTKRLIAFYVGDLETCLATVAALREKLEAVVEALEATLGYIEYNADEKDERDVYAKATAALAKAKEGQ